MLFNIDLIEVKWPYILIPRSDESNLSGVGNIIQMVTTWYFMKIFQFQYLLYQNKLSIEAYKSRQNSLVGSRFNKSVQYNWLEVLEQLG
jgi:hypothetical protein